VHTFLHVHAILAERALPRAHAHTSTRSHA
jgi:hypothetical protein